MERNYEPLNDGEMSLNEERPQSEYNTGEQDLYTGIEMVWTSYAEHLPEFEAWKTTYTAATGTDQITALDAAKALPDEAQRDELHTTLNKELGPLSDDCLISWKQLESYIRDGFPELVYQDKLNAAGHGFYFGASQKNWEDVRGLMNDGEQFIAANTAELTVGGMPATFAADFTTTKDAFDSKHAEFLQAEETSKILRDEKIIANNALFQAAMDMCEDGKKIFRKEAAKRDQFTWSTVQALIKGSQSSHSVRGVVTDSVTELPLEGGKVAVLDKEGTPIEGKEATTEADGTYKIIGLKNGLYKLKVEAEGYATVEKPFEVDGGAVDLDVALAANLV